MLLFIRLQNGTKVMEIIADDQKKIFTRNGVVENIDVDEFIYNVTSLIWNWPEHLENKDPMMRNINSYEIKVFNNDKIKKKFTGLNAFPQNYGDFLKVVEVPDNVRRK